MRTPKPWSHVFLNMAFDISFRSKDPSTQAGAVLVNTRNQILGSGFNGPPSQILDTEVPWDERTLEKPNKYQYIIHAEENCILDALSKSNKSDIEGSRMFCTHRPCIGCVLRCIHAGIEVAYWVRDYENGQNEEHIERLISSQKLVHYTNPFSLIRIRDYGL